MTRRLLFLLTLSAISSLSILLGQQKQGHVEAGAARLNYPGWGQDKQLFISIPLEQSKEPFTIKGIVLDSSSVVVRSFDDRDVKAPLFYKELPPVPSGTYRLKVTIIDKTGATKELDHFPPMSH